MCRGLALPLPACLTDPPSHIRHVRPKRLQLDLWHVECSLNSGVDNRDSEQGRRRSDLASLDHPRSVVDCRYGTTVEGDQFIPVKNYLYRKFRERTGIKY